MENRRGFLSKLFKRTAAIAVAPSVIMSDSFASINKSKGKTELEFLKELNWETKIMEHCDRVRYFSNYKDIDGEDVHINIICCKYKEVKEYVKEKFNVNDNSSVNTNDYKIQDYYIDDPFINEKEKILSETSPSYKNQPLYSNSAIISYETYKYKGSNVLKLKDPIKFNSFIIKDVDNKEISDINGILNKIIELS